MSRFHESPNTRLRVAIVLAIGLLYATTGKADATAASEAEALFAQGKTALAAEDYSRACPLFSESYRLDPATGSLLALAYCYESDGKLASALLAYRKVITRSQAEGRSDREKAAQEREMALAPQVSTLTIRSEAGLDGVDVTLDGVALDLSFPDQPMPIDGGTHIVSAKAEGREPWSLEVALATDHDHQTITLPSLATQPQPVASSPPGRVVPLVRPLAPRRPPQRVDRPPSPVMTWTVAGSMTAGIATLCAGSVLALRAVHDNNVANSGCSKDGCVDDPVQKPLRLGAAANLTLAAGGVLTMAGIVVLVLAKRASPPSKERKTAAVVAPWAAPDGGGATFHGRF